VSPDYRVMSIAPRGDAPYQVQAADAAGVLAQFGFAAPTVVAEGYGCVAALLLAAWYPARLGALVLVDAMWAAPRGESVAARALRECPPDVNALRLTITCEVHDVSAEALLERPLP
jgi:pimeloyl-ACP methyl ester carboxylesterase